MRSRFLLLLLLLVLTLISIPLQAQEPITLSVAVPGFFNDVFSEELLADFQSENPGVNIRLVDSSTLFLPSPAADLEKHLTAVNDYVSTADLVLVTSSGNFVTPEATSAGYYLDLAPLIAIDSGFNENDFFSPVWQSFQWDRGIWAMPITADPYIVSYDPAAFDAAGLAYPSPDWTLVDFDNAVRALAQKDANGKLVTPGMQLNLSSAFFRALLGHGLYDDSFSPAQPQLTSPEVQTLVETWTALQREGFFGAGTNQAPLSVASVFSLISLTEDTPKRQFALLPGDLIGLDVQGLAISAGTRYPEQAYALAEFLSRRSEITTFGTVPARQSLLGTEGTGALAGLLETLPEEARTLLQDGVVDAMPASELRFFDYFDTALGSLMNDPNLDVLTVLQEVEADAVEAQQTAADRRNDLVVAVATPIPQVDVASGEITLEFGYASFTSPLSNQEDWDALIADFVANDPQVGAVNFNVGFSAFQLEQSAERYDCFYFPFNSVPGANLSLLLNLDPFLSADPNYDADDFIGTALTQVQREGRIWGLPITVEPAILEYDPNQFENAGAITPIPGWTIDEFSDALRVIKFDANQPAPFVGSSQGGNPLLMLMAAYGGLPLDFRTDPVTIQFTDPAVVDAIRAVLDLAKDGYIEYERELGDLQTGFFNFGGGPQTAALYADSLSSLSFAALFGGNDEEESVYLPTTYPRGREYSAVSYSIGTAYISGQSQNPETCYRFINRIASTPSLFTAMPARQSLLSDPAVATAQGDEVVALYNEIANVIEDPNTISLPSLFDGGTTPTGFLYQLWLFQAFDKYVLEDADLEAALRDAETYANDFQTCMNEAPPLDLSNEETQREYLTAFADCGSKVDPRLAPLMNLIIQQAQQ